MNVIQWDSMIPIWAGILPCVAALSAAPIHHGRLASPCSLTNVTSTAIGKEQALSRTRDGQDTACNNCMCAFPAFLGPALTVKLHLSLSWAQARKLITPARSL